MTESERDDMEQQSERTLRQARALLDMLRKSQARNFFRLVDSLEVGALCSLCEKLPGRIAIACASGRHHFSHQRLPERRWRACDGAVESAHAKSHRYEAHVRPGRFVLFRSAYLTLGLEWRIC